MMHVDQIEVVLLRANFPHSLNLQFHSGSVFLGCYFSVFEWDDLSFSRTFLPTSLFNFCWYVMDFTVGLAPYMNLCPYFCKPILGLWIHFIRVYKQIVFIRLEDPIMGCILPVCKMFLDFIWKLLYQES